ncbi:hypothetical protein [Kitasatospora sp. NPDC093806]|uniref:hypothetical protein n=1 Tax=Kitasatospora sp. NPDC093806 TaxID=3155075 RepID=UPI00341848D7
MISAGDIEWLASISGQGQVDPAWDEDEHVRYGLYVRSLKDSEADVEDRVVEIVLRDPDRTMAQAALVDHVDRLALEIRELESFCRRVDRVGEQAGELAFLRQRIREWILAKTSAVDPDSVIEDVLGSSHWLQRGLADSSESVVLLEALAERGLTRKIKNRARDRARQLGK